MRNFEPSKTEFNVHALISFSSYRAVNTVRLGYTNQTVNIVQDVYFLMYEINKKNT